MQNNPDTKQLRSFGLLVGGIFTALGILPLLFGKEVRLWAVSPAAVLIFLALLLPSSLGPVYRVWMVIGHVLGWINTRIILSVVFYGIFLPMGFVMRLAGKDPMRRQFQADADTYRVPCSPRPASHMFRQF